MPLIKSNAFHPLLADSRIKYPTQGKSGSTASCVGYLDEGTRRAVWFGLPFFRSFLGTQERTPLHGNATYARF